MVTNSRIIVAFLNKMAIFFPQENVGWSRHTQEKLPSLWLSRNLDAVGFLLYHLDTKLAQGLRRGGWSSRSTVSNRNPLFE